jgi:thioredoxin
VADKKREGIAKVNSARSFNAMPHEEMAMSILGGMRGGGPKSGDGGGSAIPFVTERDFEQVVIRSELPVLVQFTTAWSEPCKHIAPDVEAFAQEMEGKVKVVRVDVDRAQNLANQLRVEQLPTFMVFAEQRIANGAVGAITKKRMHELVDPVLPRAEGAIKALELAQLVKEGSVSLVDARDAGAFGRAHLPGATNIPAEEIETRLAELHMLASPPVLYCRSGDKTKELAAKLAEQGMPVAFLEGGILAWESEALPIQRG